MSNSSESDLKSFGDRVPFIKHMGLELRSCENGHSEMHYRPKPEHSNSLNVVHGGAVMTLLDVSMATAARSVAPNLWVVTIEMKTSFLQPAQGPLIAKGHLLHKTRAMAFVETHMYDAQGALCAHASGTFKYIDQRATDPLISAT